ncbi:2-dehydro-3-deoxy-6-phosphogalactonate aldolase [Stenotrophomonas sp. ZAC14D1_NAIMI4_6]|uniref:2-dehydro-3-deoxy-6-phosphogalactonate aldolase n=2 Tax=Lysobacteraceae TaxID=32033 RepID=UPI000D542219|nr:2-dehydro-3-deoxy-6-phosphogalactonate aldolase [Stenotrophomonas sp. ZAC14D1_NAIMI4_6]AWH36377.1 2-dehydro-3-deoxy-6-phosphogalactonate aldolase [Stenotrophomonas sp. ZAC14D1_NAIMI4_6]AWH40568.1 2-dehydro-3-deoxy-6-phosphogalactonate aldolase [Stenotrophomonas sp. ZAC14D1_NAIMI4_1]
MSTAWMQPLPLVAILRGLTPQEAPAIGAALADAGFHLLEVPLNSPQPLHSIELLARQLGDRCLVGAGTVLTTGQVQDVANAGGRLLVMPHADVEVIASAHALGMRCTPGVATPTEAFAALRAGADALKLFPAEQLPPPVLKAWSSVLPAGTALLPVGGITPERMAAYRSAGAAGFGIGSALYAPGTPAAEVARRARAFIDAWHQANTDSHA